ncbi:hypothetical protein V5F59_07530 [Xanthobacter autotrophicus DSM 431]|uniref:hypothetical protein n=1 Tax=Xanthobacter nonsaccharivorans TaxID=3119912 RepID=UPI0037289899
MEWIAQALGIVNTNVLVPGWVVFASLVLGAVFVFLLFVRSEPNENPLTILVLIGILVGGLAIGTGLVRQLNASSAIAEAKALEARAAALDAAAAQSQALGCLGADPQLASVCEVVLFERPDTVAAARALVRARMALVEDAFEFVRRREATYLTERIAAWRKPLEQDNLGLVAAALVDYSGCTPSYCPQAAVVGDPARILANMSEGRYAALVAKYTPIWERNARNRGTLTQAAPPPRSGPFGFAVAPHDTATTQGLGNTAQPQERPVNLPVEDTDVQATQPPLGPAPLPPSRPAPPPVQSQAAPPAAPRPAAARPAAPRPRPQPAAPQAEPQAEPAAADDGQ